MIETNPALSQLIFSDASRAISHFLSDSRKSALSISARIRSIDQDAEFVQQVRSAYGLPLVANERCGSWYIDPAAKVQSAYFKSTDGHAGQWSLSLRRLNLQVLETVADGKGCIIVDSTRRGKSMPDALSKSVPIWIAVWNRLLFPDDATAGRLETPSDIVPPSEHSQIEARLDGFLTQLKTLQIDLTAIRARCKKPMLPIWITHTAGLMPPITQDGKYHPVLLCTASRHLPSQLAAEQGYVQGAADDHESWAHGLTPQLYWSHKAELLKCAEDELPGLIRHLTERTNHGPQTVHSAVLIRPTTNLFVCPNEIMSDIETDDLHIRIRDRRPLSQDQEDTTSGVLDLICPPGKLGSRALRLELTKLEPFLKQRVPFRGKLYVSCPTGKDHSIGVALTVLCLYLSGAALEFTDRDSGYRRLDKDLIRQRLGLIMQSVPDANPSRSTLQSVNAFLLC